VNKNRRKKPLKKLKAAIICVAFFLVLCVCLNILITQTRAHAAYLNAAEAATLTQSTADPTLVLEDPTPTVAIDPTPIPTTPPIPTATATPRPVPTQAPVPTATPKPAPAPQATPTPTPVIPILQPTPTIAVGGIIPPGNPPITTTPTSNPTPTPTPKASKTPLATTPTAVATTTANTTGTTDSTQDSNKNKSSGLSPLVKPIGFGLAFAVLISAFLGFFFLRKQKDNRPIPFSTFSQALSQAAQPAPWLNQQNPNAALALSGGDYLAASNEQTLMQQATSSTSSPPSAYNGAQTAIPMPNTTQKRTVVSAISGPAFNQAGIETIPYPSSSDLRPITTPLPALGRGFAQKNPVSTSDMNPLPFDNLDFANILPPLNEQGAQLWDKSTNTGKNPIAASSLIAPSIQDDPILETIMRQAQMGIYAIADKSPSDLDDETSDAFLT
jgi:outer membrane biosynthesis protein TonB